MKNESQEEERKNNTKNKIETEEKKKTHNTKKCLYTCESIINSYEYTKMTKYFPNYWFFVIKYTILNIIFTAFIAIFSKNGVATSIIFALCQIFVLLFCKIRLESLAERAYMTDVIKRYNLEKGTKEFEIQTETEFYETYFIRKDEKTSLKVDYSEINRCVENDTHFYLAYPPRNLIFIFQKNRCSLELINFIRNTFKTLENHLGDTAKIKGVKTYHHPTLIITGMLILFVTTLVSLFGATYSFFALKRFLLHHGFNFINNAWVFWCWLPIPILSIILGFKYKHAGFECKKNIIAGFIMAFLLLGYSLFFMVPTPPIDYSEIEAYKNIIDAKLPDSGELEVVDMDFFADDDKTAYTVINVYYDNEDVSDLVSSIENNNHWILSETIPLDLQMLIPSALHSDKDAYFSIFNNTTKEYNTVPNETGNYEIFAMKYDKSEKHLEIHKFISINLTMHFPIE